MATKAGDRDPMERVAFWRAQVEKLRALPENAPARQTMLTTAEERLRHWERRARVRSAA